MTPKLGKALELAALGAGGIGGYGLGRLLAAKVLERDPKYAEKHSEVTEGYIARHPKLSSIIAERSHEKRASFASSLKDRVAKAPTSWKTVGGMLGLGLLGGIPAGSFMKMHEATEENRFEHRYDGLDKLEMAHALAADEVIAGINAVREKRKGPEVHQ